MYDVHHKNQSDPVATLMSHPRKGTGRRVWYTMANRLNYTGKAVPLGVELLDALQATADGLSHYEIAADAVALSGAVGFIHTAGLVRKNGRTWGIKGNDRNQISIGSSTSAKYATVYGKGKRLNRENKQYQGRAAVAANVVAPEDVSELMRLEWNLKAKAAKALRYQGKPVTLRTLLDPLARLSILRQQTEAGFTFKYPGRAGAVVPFFNWPAIDAAYRAQNGLSATDPPTPVTTKAPRPRARKSTATYGAKQAIRKLTADSRPGDYLAAATRPELQTMTTAALTDPRRIRRLARKLSAAGCGVNDDEVTAILTEWMTATAAPAVAAAIAPAAPILLARAITAEHDLDHYLGRQYVARRRLPAVHRPPDSLAVLPPAPRL
ncbi:hypothetical protein A3850_009565 [Lewinella sp. 4G2]|nr:hypothetical protein A3850_009565 [Lewinella sp. 4G2]